MKRLEQRSRPGRVHAALIRSKHLSLIAVSVTLCACTAGGGGSKSPGSPTGGPIFPTVLTYSAWKEKTSSQEIHFGTLEELGGCVALGNGGSRGENLVWPAGVTIRSTSGGTWGLYTSDGKIVSAQGHQISVDGDSVDLATARSMVDGGLPSGCSADAFFVVRHVVER